MTRTAPLITLLVAAAWLSVAVAAEESTGVNPPAQAEPDFTVLVQVNGVNTLSDYAAVERLLGALPGARRLDVSDAQGARITFRLVARGDSAGLEHALESSGQLTRETGTGGSLVYDYRR